MEKYLPCITSYYTTIVAKHTEILIIFIHIAVRQLKRVLVIQFPEKVLRNSYDHQIMNAKLSNRLDLRDF